MDQAATDGAWSSLVDLEARTATTKDAFHSAAQGSKVAPASMPRHRFARSNYALWFR